MYAKYAKKNIPWRRVLCLLLAFCFLLGAAPRPFSARAAQDYSWVRVKLSTNNASSLSLGVSGTYFIEENGIEFTGGTLTLRAAGGRMSLSHSSYGEIFSGSYCSIKRARVDRSAGHISLNGRKYLGHFNCHLASNGYIQLVNEVPMAHYLYGVVGYEMSDSSFPLEALKAQAIAAKCYVIAQIGSAAAYDIGDTSADQVYKGYNASYTNVIQAVDSTLSMVLAANGSIIRSYFAASNGGETTLPSYAWPTKNRSDTGYAIAQDSYDLANTYSPREVVRFPVNSAGSISANLHAFLMAKAQAALGFAVAGIENISAVQTFAEANPGTTRNLTQCSVSLTVLDASGMAHPISFTFRLSELYANHVVNNGSLRIYWGEQTDANTYCIYHLRYGHGVGLSQRGAQQRAKEGQSYAQILAFYYPYAGLTSTGAIQPPADPVNSKAGSAVLPGFTPDPGVPMPVPSPAPGAAGDVIAYGRINYDGTNYRSGPSSDDYPSYGKLSLGTALEILGESGSWYRVRVGGMEAWVFKQYVDITGTPAPTTAPQASPIPTAPPIISAPAAIGTGVLTTSSVNFRTGPSTSASILGKFDKGDAVSIYAQQGEWLHVSIQGVYGYVHADYVRVQSAAPAPTANPVPSATPAPQTLQSGMLSTSNVNLRSGPSTSYSSLGKLSKNTPVRILAQSGDWYHVQTGGREGYVYAQYIRLNENAAASSAAQGAAPAGAAGAGRTSGKVNLRSGPSTSHTKLDVLRKGTALTLYGSENGWYKVEAGGKSGYVSGKYVEVTASYAAPSTSPVPAGSLVTTTTENVKTTYGETIAKVYFREGPSTSSKKIALLPKGAKLVVYGLEDGWFDAVYNMKRGYVSSEYVMLGVPLEASQVSTTTVRPIEIQPLVQNGASAAQTASANSSYVSPALGMTTGEVNFRTLPDTRYGAVIETLNKQTQVQLLGRSADWYYVFYNNNTGYISAAYINLTSAGSFGLPAVEAGTKGYSTFTSAKVNMRTGPSTDHSVLRQLEKGAALTVLLKTGGWGLVLQSGQYGFVREDYIK